MLFHCIHTFTGHTAKVLDVAVNVNTIISGSADKTIGLWNITTKSVSFLEGHDIATNCVSFFKNSSTIISGGHDGTMRIWDISSKKSVCTLTHPNILETGGVMCIMLVDDKIIAGHESGAVSLWDDSTGSYIQNIEKHSDNKAITTSLAFFQTGSSRYVISGRTDATLTFWDFVQDQLFCIIRTHKDPVTCLKVVNNLILSASQDHTVHVWSMDTNNCIKTLTGHTDRINCLAISGNFIISGSDDCSIKIWDMHTWQCVHTLTGHTKAVTCLDTFGNLLISGSADNTIKVWQL